MLNQHQTNKNWLPCERGAITKVVDRQIDSKRRQILKSAGTVAAMIIIGGGVTGLVLSEKSEPGPPTRGNYLSCLEVRNLMHLYERNQLDAEMMARIAKHLNVCPPCYDRFHEHRQTV